ncbi:hypothetical protein UFOVP1077_7 [uncultured Caudovirales phage]|uniref:Uncharacterized protein n=1 Tax=uncultured Caudovirales phage TaxID=2100421 RepID=A0A6J5SBS4_9CAUD|nr:hypothetical protein UFOVP1077_7 [uncultured Caudovirales phage]CAB4198112.1 hypothetical protein UFOVP1316_50 [uncultured Caudovirales phage]CAB4211324.1 hypothetical protein UFOVP1428_4 [uncultured Caudovirales phage]CAB5227415.1 hypothetical protein UFOVP1526_40 [uncultured Caudovirales phage]
MKLKRKFEPVALAAWQDKYPTANTRRTTAEKPPMSHIEVLSASPRWHVPHDLIETGVAEGWISVGDGKLTLKTGPDVEDVVYKIVRIPGHYCDLCHAKLESSNEGPDHLAAHHGGSGTWRRDNFYFCTLESGAVAKTPVSKGKPSIFKRLFGG